MQCNFCKDKPICKLYKILLKETELVNERIFTEYDLDTNYWGEVYIYLDVDCPHHVDINDEIS